MPDPMRTAKRSTRGLVTGLTLAAPLLAIGTYAFLGVGTEPLHRWSLELGAWKVLIASQVAAWTLFLAFGIRGLVRLEASIDEWSHPGLARRNRWQRETILFLVLVYGTLSAMLVIGGFAKLQNPRLLADQSRKIALLHVVAGAASSPFLIGLKRIQLYAEDDGLWPGSADDIGRLQVLRRYLRSATAAMGTIVALAVVSTGALRNAVVAVGKIPLPQEFVLIYGAFLTGVVGAVYVYVFSAIEARARSILQTAAPLPDPDVASADHFSAVVKLRGELADVLELGGDPRKNLEGLIAVFAPLLGALITGVGLGG